MEKRHQKCIEILIFSSPLMLRVILPVNKACKNQNHQWKRGRRPCGSQSELVFACICLRHLIVIQIRTVPHMHKRRHSHNCDNRKISPERSTHCNVAIPNVSILFVDALLFCCLWFPKKLILMSPTFSFFWEVKAWRRLILLRLLHLCKPFFQIEEHGR